jgi:hypothetical protein
MPLTDKGAEIKGAMTDQYGEKKGEQVFYASKNKGTITGVDSAASRPLYGAKRGRDIFYGARDQQPGLVTEPNAGFPAGILYEDDDDD